MSADKTCNVRDAFRHETGTYRAYYQGGRAWVWDGITFTTCHALTPNQIAMVRSRARHFDGLALVIWNDRSGWSLEDSSGAILASGAESSKPAAMRRAGVVVAPGAVRRCSDPDGVIYPVTRY